MIDLLKQKSFIYLTKGWAIAVLDNLSQTASIVIYYAYICVFSVAQYIIMKIETHLIDST